MIPYSHALIVGAGPGLSASLARKLSAQGLRVTLAARNLEKLAELAAETGARTHALDASDREAVAALFAELDAEEAPDVVVYNPSARVRGPIEELDGAAVEAAVAITALGAFHVAQQAARRMVPAGHGAILLTGASAGVKGFPNSSVFAMGKFALRGLAQSLARELHPKGVHVGHVVIDGGIRSAVREPASPDALLEPDAVAQTYLDLLAQPRSAWSWEIEIRPWVEKF
ncbi:SDR family NAD(P)-dependent oxidoreductase [Albimonas sp. CAU 1670]|uniref:SDR family NAD(P)-dependent oxidoreductase n=1 Tax=Albimonas sp. CAU 1670 TaxID=3032599 RepID=UPI0023DC77C0|nr:SDR family NAD(P)-dependent oxidoreductase [Albimonas sp. CAU 1670]MDF2234946.1 SDR family NAD(P)-dependent oxidoreductase [Albimonas sp. CAU 1670]